MKKANLEKFPAKLLGTYSSPYAMEAAIRNHLIGLAMQCKTTSYGNLCLDLNLPFNLKLQYHRTLLGTLLGIASETEMKAGRVPISVVVVEVTNMIPSIGFYTMMEDFGHDVPDINILDNKRSYFGIWLSRVWKYWKNKRKDREKTFLKEANLYVRIREEIEE
jgi:hypothetical protein